MDQGFKEKRPGKQVVLMAHKKARLKDKPSRKEQQKLLLLAGSAFRNVAQSNFRELSRELLS